MSGEVGRIPWQDGDIVITSVAVLLGAIGVVAAWFGASGIPTPATQMSWLNLAIGGFAVASGGLCHWLLSGRRAVGARRMALVSLHDVESDHGLPSGARES